jgi:hypothetical protein
MGSKVRVGAAVASLLILTSVTAATTAAGDKGSSGSYDRKVVVLHLMGRLVGEQTYIDKGLPDNSQGDQYVYAYDLFSRGTKVGQEGGSCTVTLVEATGATTVYCLGNHSLPGGQVTTRGVITYGPDEEFNQDPYSVAMTGGTGR